MSPWAGEALAIGSPGRVRSEWRRSFRLGEQCVVPLSVAGPDIETRIFLKHAGLFYLQPLGEWAPRSEIRFLPEAPGAYTVLVEWRSAAGAGGWTEAMFDVAPETSADPSPRLVNVERDLRLWVPSAWEAHVARAHEKPALTLATKNLRRNAVVYDVGANLGLYSVLLSRIAGPGGHVYCFEANPVCLYFLQANLALNRVPAFDILPVAIHGRATSTQFRINYRNLLVGLAGTVPDMGKPGHVIEVAAAALDDLVEHHGLRPPDFIKMDIEGGEVEAIKGMRRTIERSRPAILVELHGQGAARGTLDGIDWSGYAFEEAASGRTFADAGSLRDWFPDACLQVIARPS